MFWGGVALCKLSAGVDCASASDIVYSDRIVMVRYLNDPDAPANKAALVGLGAEISWRSQIIPTLVALKCPQGNAKIVAETLALSADVKYAEQACGPGVDHSLDPSCSGAVYAPANPSGITDLTGQQWAIKNSGQPILDIAGRPGADMNIVPAWAITMGNPSIIVAVAERAGVDIAHHEIKESLWINAGETGFDAQGNSRETNGIDDDNDGVIDDVHGISVTGYEEIVITGNPTPDPSFSPGRDHGTSVAGLIFASHSHSGIVGIAPGCRLLSSRLMYDGFDNLTVNATIALDYFLKKGTRISTWAFGFAWSNAFEDMVEAAEELGHILVASAGNEGCNLDNRTRLHYPTMFGDTHKNVITVAALDNRDCLAAWPTPGICTDPSSSNYGPTIVLCAAPGWHNLSTQRYVTPPPDVTYFNWFGGTSAAAPNAAGAIALLLSVHPELTPAQVRERIIATGRPVPSLAGKTISGKAIDVYHLLAD